MDWQDSTDCMLFLLGLFYIDFSVSRLFPLPSASIVQT